MTNILRILSFTCLLPVGLQAQPANALPFERGVRIDVVAAKPAAVKGGDYDDKMQKIELRMKFSNLDTRQSYDGYSLSVSVLGQSTLDRGVRKVLAQEQVALSLAPRKVVEHTCKPVTTRFDKTGAVFGYAYDGWIIVVKDSAGKIVHIKSTSPTLEKLPEKADKLEQNKCYNKNLEPVDDPDGSRRSSVATP